MSNFLPTFGNLIAEIDKIIRTIPPCQRDDYARLFTGTETQKLLFSSKDFEEAASEYCREAGFGEPT